MFCLNGVQIGSVKCFLLRFNFTNWQLGVEVNNVNHEKLFFCKEFWNIRILIFNLFFFFLCYLMLFGLLEVKTANFVLVCYHHCWWFSFKIYIIFNQRQNSEMLVVVGPRFSVIWLCVKGKPQTQKCFSWGMWVCRQGMGRGEEYLRLCSVLCLA